MSPNPEERLRLVQVVPHDSPPFGRLCEAYARAAEKADFHVQTFVLGKPHAQPLAGFDYLGESRLHRTGRIAARIAAMVDEPDEVSLVLCHRYRAFRVALESGFSTCRLVAVAHEYGMLSSWRRRVHRRLFAREARFAGVSRGVAEELAEVTGFLLMLPNLLDLQRADTERLTRDTARRQLGVDRDDFVIGTVGRLHYKKRPDMAVAAVRRFRQHGNHSVRHLFIGRGDEVKGLQAEQDRVVGFVENAAALMPGLDVLLHTGDVEGFGMVLLEAMAAGVAVAATDSPGPREVLGDLGFFPASDDADGFAAALQMAQQASAEHLQAGIERARDLYSIPAMSRRLVALADFVAEPEQG